MNEYQLAAIKTALDLSMLDPDSEAMKRARQAIKEAEEMARNSISIVWQIEDVLEVRPDLTEDEAGEVLGMVESNHDANLGISWDTLKITADYLYPEDESEEE